ncbi:CHAT domain-containing protein [uncultured Kushneria sp.]|uniref:CHAT domain-containing protein n=1 Tax=uncultured Kushneria sp. TaxID=905033 RepID=UPI002602CD32|nr:CHAT domain-containing protein [uncultured Kushneria sp.]
MSIETLRNRIAQLEREKANFERSLSREQENARKKQAEISQISRSINKNTSVSSLSSKQRQIESKQRQLSGYEKKAADLQSKVAGKNAELLKKLSEVGRAEKQEQRRNDQEEKKRQGQQLSHSKHVTRELERQAQIHRQLSSAPIVVQFADLPKKITVLFIASNPTDQTQLRLDEEIRAITKKIRESEYRDAVELKSLWATRPDDLLQALNEYKPTIVHFSGHGSDLGELVLQDDSGHTKLISLEAIVQLFTVMASGIELIVFNACFSYAQAERVTSHVKAAIGTNDSVGDEAARVFAAQLYSAIGFGKSVREAFAQAKVALQLEGIKEEDIPELYVAEDIDDESLVLVRPET